MPEYVKTSGACRILAEHGIQVSAKTVSRWGKEGKLPYIRTLGGHRRYPVKELREIAERHRHEVTE